VTDDFSLLLFSKSLSIEFEFVDTYSMDIFSVMLEGVYPLKANSA